jgi:DNA-binding MarR family transcriptional regulator
MSLLLLGKVIEDQEITDSTEFRVLIALADGNETIEGIAKCARAKREGALRALDRMERKRWIRFVAGFYEITKYGRNGGDA